jgi:SHS family sialic acid transporter-like MFS transporter
VALLVETWPEKRRAILAGLMGAGANVGFLIAALYSRALIDRGFGWRWIVGMGFFVGMSSLAVLIFVPESPQWKRAQERRASSRLADLFTPRYRRSTVVGSLLSTTALLGVWGSFLWLPAYVDQITEGTPMEGKAKTIVSLWSAGGQIVGAFLGGLIAGWMGNRRSGGCSVRRAGSRCTSSSPHRIASR